MTIFYVAVLERKADGHVFAHVPDLPGVTSLGSARGQALRYVTEYANEHVRYLAEAAVAIPMARDIDAIPVESPEFARALIPVDVPGKSVRVSLSVDDALLRHVDRAAAAKGITRSAYFSIAATEALRQKS
jgi:predicted RNase H-like HicB family nuclease